jgi:hypothetical protein
LHRGGSPNPSGLNEMIDATALTLVLILTAPLSIQIIIEIIRKIRKITK